MQQPQQQVIIIQQPVAAIDGGHVFVEAESYPRGTATFLGVLQILLALVSFFGASLAYVYLADNYLISYGFWCGAFFFPSAVAVLHASRQPTRQKMKHAITWACVAIAFAGTEFALSLDGLIINIYDRYPSTTTYVCWWWYWWATLCYYDYPAMVAANGIMVGASGIELLLCFVQIHISARAIKKIRPQVQPSAATVEMRSVQRFNLQQPTVTVIETQQPSYSADEVVVIPPSYDLLAPPTYDK